MSPNIFASSHTGASRSHQLNDYRESTNSAINTSVRTFIKELTSSNPNVSEKLVNDLLNKLR